MTRFILAVLAALVALVVLPSHDMFLKLDSYFLEPNTPAEVKLFNGTFEESGNSIRRVRCSSNPKARKSATCACPKNS